MQPKSKSGPDPKFWRVSKFNKICNSPDQSNLSPVRWSSLLCGLIVRGTRARTLQLSPSHWRNHLQLAPNDLLPSVSASSGQYRKWKTFKNVCFIALQTYDALYACFKNQRLWNCLRSIWLLSNCSSAGNTEPTKYNKVL